MYACPARRTTSLGYSHQDILHISCWLIESHVLVASSGGDAQTAEAASVTVSQSDCFNQQLSIPQCNGLLRSVKRPCSALGCFRGSKTLEGIFCNYNKHNYAKNGYPIELYPIDFGTIWRLCMVVVRWRTFWQRNSPFFSVKMWRFTTYGGLLVIWQ